MVTNNKGNLLGNLFDYSHGLKMTYSNSDLSVQEWLNKAVNTTSKMGLGVSVVIIPVAHFSAHIL